MLAHMDFSMPASLLWALIVGALQPLVLLAVTRWSRLAGRNALQFLLCTLGMWLLWLVSVAIVPAVRPINAVEAVLCQMVLAGSALFYLEVWGLLSRGYTLSVLLTLLKAGRPLTGAEIASLYRGGDGLDWIMHHRLGGLEAAGLVERQGDRVTLSPFRGMLIARLYAVSIAVLGLHRTG